MNSGPVVDSDASTRSVASHRSQRAVIAIVIGLIWSNFSGDFVRAALPGGIAGIPYSRSLLASLSDVIVIVGLLRIVAGVPLADAVRVIGLRRPPVRAIAALLALFASTIAICAAFLPVSDSESPAALWWLAFGGPLFEEVTFRGLAIGTLMIIAGWRLLPAAALTAAAFGVGHAWQGSGLGDAAAIIAITMIGGLLLGWMYVRWRFNLWPPLLAHIGLNLVWAVFEFGDNAIGGWLGNGVRLTLIVLILGGTYWMTRDLADRR